MHEVLPEVLALRERLVQAELRTEAVRAGMVDLDGVKLIDKAALVVDEAGGLVDGAGVIAALRVAKPYLFAVAKGTSSSSGAVAPRAAVAAPKSAMQMSVEEWRAARAILLRRV